MSQPLVVAILILESDVQAVEYFRGKGKNDFETLAGGQLIYFAPDTIIDLFESEVHERYPELKRSNLSCIWAEDPEKHHFIVSLRDLDSDQIRNVLSDLGDAAEGVEDAESWEKAFKELQMKRQKDQKATPRSDSDKVPPAATPDHVKGGDPSKEKRKDGEGGETEKLGGRGDIDILRLFGKYGGLAGLGLGVLFLLFGRLTFPRLTAGQATPYMFLIYGVAVLGMIIWAIRDEKKRSSKYILSVIALVIGILAWLTLPRTKAEDPPYTVLVTVLNPDKQPVSDAHVSSNIGVTPLRSEHEDKWQIPVPSTAKGQTLTVYADVEDQGWKGSTDQLLGDNHSPSMNVPLKETGEIPVRGTVKGGGGRVIPNAFVSIAGYEAKVTNASGQFQLTSHAARGKTVHIHAEMAPNLVADLPAYEVGSAPAELTLQPSGANDRNRVQPAKPHDTGDVAIDDVLTQLYSLQHGSRAPTEAQLADALAPLFNRPAFYSTREQDWGHFLYPLCRTRLLLEQYEGEFKSSPAVRKNIGDAVKKMVLLQNDIAGLYGPNFRIDEHIRTYISNSDKFIQNLPRLETTPSPDFYDARDQQIKQIRESLQAAGLLENP